MVGMVGSITRIKELLRLFFKFGFALDSAYVLNFVLATLGKILRIFLLMVFFKTLILAVPDIPGWSEPALYVLAATFYITDLIASVFFHRNLLFHLPRMIQDGSFDRMLVTPLSRIFHVAFHRIDVGDVLSLIPFIYFWYYILTRFTVSATFSSVLLYTLLVINAIAFIFGLVLLLGSVSFWTIQGDGFGRFIDHVTGAARIPLDIFPQPFKYVLSYLFPLVILSTIPTQALFGSVTLFDVGYAVCFTIGLLCVSGVAWTKGLRAYNSASS
jgi:ABC-2 type transport system permease protein